MTIEEIEKEWLTAKVWAESGTMTGEMMSQKELAEWADKFGPKLIAVVRIADTMLKNKDSIHSDYKDHDIGYFTLRGALKSLERDHV